MQVVESGGAVVQETRGWSEAEQRTFSQRSKEFAEDYRYFPEPDLPPLELDRAWVEELRSDVAKALEHHPARLSDEFVSKYGLSRADASILASEPEMADLFRAVSYEYRDFANEARARKLAANWIAGEVLPRFRKQGLGQLSAENLAILIQLVEETGEVTRDQGRLILDRTMQNGRHPKEIASDLGLYQERDTHILDSSIRDVILENNKAWRDFVAGKEAAGGVLVGKVRAKTGGVAKPEFVLK